MPLRRLPLADPGEPDTRSGFRLLLWLEFRQWRGQLAATAWGSLHMVATAAVPAAGGLAVQAVADRSASRLALAAGLTGLLGVLIAAFVAVYVWKFGFEMPWNIEQ